MSNEYVTAPATQADLKRFGLPDLDPTDFVVVTRFRGVFENNSAGQPPHRTAARAPGEVGKV